MWSSQRRWREKEIPVTERLCSVGLHREERGRSGRDEQQLSDILFVPPPPSRLHYDSFSVRVKVRPDSSAAVYGYVWFFLCVCVLTWVFRSAHTKQMGGDGNEESQTENQTERFIGGK